MLHRSQLLYNRARLLTALGRLEEAYQDFSTLTQLDPYYTDYFSERAKISRKRGDLVAALADYARAEALAPPFPELHYNRGTAYDELGELELAIREFEVVLELEPGDLPTQLSLADALIRLQDLDSAEAVVQRGLQLLPGDPQLLCMQGSIMLAGAQEERAIEVLDQVLGADPHYPAALVNRAVAAYRLGRPAESVRDLTTCLTITGDDPDLRLNRGLALLDMAEPDRALADFDRALELPEADLAELHQGRARALLATGQPELAAAELQACRELGCDEARRSMMGETATAS